MALWSCNPRAPVFRLGSSIHGPGFLIPRYHTNRDLLQERTTSKQLQLQNLGYRKDLVMGVGSCFTPLETWSSHYKADKFSCHVTLEPSYWKSFWSHSLMCRVSNVSIWLLQSLISVSSFAEPPAIISSSKWMIRWWMERNVMRMRMTSASMENVR